MINYITRANVVDGFLQGVRSHEAENNFWEKESSIYNALANYYDRTLKDVPSYLTMNGSYFNKLKSVNQVFIVGHSLGEVDMPYFKRVANSVQAKAVWNIYYNKDEDLDIFKAKIISIGAMPELIKPLHSINFFL